jgi:lipopolysaccharide export system protein LptC
VNDRRLMVAVVVLALAVGVVQLAVWWLKPPPAPDTFVGPPRSGYTLEQFTLDSYGVDGKLSVRLSAPQLQRREGDDSLYLNAPTFLLPPQNGASGAPWHGKSQYGWVNADATVMKLQGKVEIHRPASPQAEAAEVLTADVTAWPKQNALATQAPTQILGDTYKISGVGLKADLKTQRMELLSDVHANFAAPKHR